MQVHHTSETKHPAKTLTALAGTAYEVRLSTEEAAAALKVKPQTLRAALCRDGHYMGTRPVKSANRFLKWNASEIERLAAGESI
jgi:hypothetical protein